MKPLKDKRENCGPVVKKSQLTINNELWNFGVRINLLAFKAF